MNKKKKCFKNKERGGDKDTWNYDYIFTWQKKKRLLKIGKKYNCDCECFSGYCNDLKCSTFKEYKLRWQNSPKWLNWIWKYAE